MTTRTSNYMTEIRKMTVERKKVLVLGDAACGKTSLLVRFTADYFPEEYVPTIFSSHLAELVVDLNPLELALWDTSGDADLRSLCRVSFMNADVAVICYSVDCPESLDNVKNWVSEVNDIIPGSPIILVANKMELRCNSQVSGELRKTGQSPVTTEKGQAMAERVGAFAFLECSAKDKDGVDLVFKTAAQAARGKHRVMSKRSKRLFCFS